MSEETKNLNHTDDNKEDVAKKGMSMKERKKALEEKRKSAAPKFILPSVSWWPSWWPPCSSSTAAPSSAP